MTSERDEYGLATAGRSESPSRGREREAVVPIAYAEKTMSTLLRLHDDLVEEKERRIDLYRRLMDREQDLAELRAYVRLLEAELARRDEAAQAPAAAPAEAPPPANPEIEKTAAAASAPPADAERAPAPGAPVQRTETPPQKEAESAGMESGPVVAWLPANLRQL